MCAINPAIDNCSTVSLVGSSRIVIFKTLDDHVNLMIRWPRSRYPSASEAALERLQEQEQQVPTLPSHYPLRSRESSPSTRAARALRFIDTQVDALRLTQLTQLPMYHCTVGSVLVLPLDCLLAGELSSPEVSSPALNALTSGEDKALKVEVSSASSIPSSAGSCRQGRHSSWISVLLLLLCGALPAPPGAGAAPDTRLPVATRFPVVAAHR